MAIAAWVGIAVSSFILPGLGWSGVFFFFGGLSLISGVLLLLFNDKPLPDNKPKVKSKRMQQRLD